MLVYRKAFLLLVLLTGFLVSCASDEPWLKTKAEFGNGSGPFTASTETPIYRVPKSSMVVRQQFQLSLTNLLGDVSIHHLQPSMTDEACRIVVSLKDGAKPPVMDLRPMDEGWHFLMLDSADAVYQSEPECPTERKDGTIVRLNTVLPRIDIDVYVVDGALIRVMACANLEVNAKIDLIARAGKTVTISGGSGKAVVNAPKLLSQTNTYSTIATVSEEAWFSNVVGYRGVRGTGNVTMTSGGGIADVDVTGNVVVRGALAGGSPRGFSGASYLDDKALELIGPVRPILGSREHAKSASEISSSIRGNRVELYLPRSLSIEIIAQVEKGTVDLWLPKNAGIIQHDMTRSTAHFSLGNPNGELRVNAEHLAKIIIE